jgi:Helix-turn-helix domain
LHGEGCRFVPDLKRFDATPERAHGGRPATPPAQSPSAAAPQVTSFREVVDDARKQLAVGYLGDRRLAVSEVAYLLGYSEAGAFVRAFKRWTGKTPGEMRAGA